MPHAQSVELVATNTDLNRANKSGESLLELAHLGLYAFILEHTFGNISTSH